MLSALRSFRFLPLIFCMTCVAASANTIMLDFETLSEGDIVANQYAPLGIVVSGSPEIFAAGSLLDEIDFPPHSGMNLLVDVNGPVTFTFDSPVSAIGAYFTYTEELTLQAFDPFGRLLQTGTSSSTQNFGGPDVNEFVGFSGVGDIGSLVVTGAPDGLGPSFTLDDLTVTAPVPEPSTMVLVLSSLLVVWARQRWVRRAVSRPLRAAPSSNAVDRRLTAGVGSAPGVLVVALVAACAGRAAIAPGTIASLVPSPSLVYVTAGPALPVTVTLSANVAIDSKLMTGSVELIQVTSTGQLVKVIGPMYDDGTHGDGVAGDNIFTAQVSVPILAPTSLYYRASAAYTGIIQRGQSPIASVSVANSSSAMTPAPSTIVTVNNNTYPVDQAVFTVPVGTTQSAAQSIAQACGGLIVGYSSTASQYQVQFPGVTTPAPLQSAVACLSSQSSVKSAMNNYVIVPFSTPIVDDLTNLALAIPGKAAAYDKIGAIDAYDFLLDVNATFVKTTIGIVDSGIEASHPEFAGVNFGGSSPSDLTDSTGHGTSVGGIIGANCGSCGGGLYQFPQMNGILAGIPGIAAGTSALPYVIESRNWGGGTMAEVAAKVDDLLTKGVDILVISGGWYAEGATGSSGCPPASCLKAADFTSFANTLAAAFGSNPGVTVLAGAGNFGIGVNNVLPAALSKSVANVVSVAATDLNDVRTSSSDFDFCPTALAAIGFPAAAPCGIQIAAPGVNVYAPTAPSGYTNFQGTSAAVALAAGAAGVLHSVSGGTGALDGNTTKKRLQFGADTIADTTVSGLRLNLNSTVGASLVDVYFLIDTTGSMGPSISGVKASEVDAAAQQLRSENLLNIDIGAGQFRDFPISPYGGSGDEPYRPVIDLAAVAPFFNQTLLETFVRQIGPLAAGGGSDIPEAQLTALYQMATGAGQDVGNPSAADYIAPGQQANWRTCPTAPFPAACNLMRLAVLLTDASFHCTGTGPFCSAVGPHMGFQTTIDALNAKGIKVMLVQPDDGGNLLSASGDQANALTQFGVLANGTNSIAPVAIDCLGDGTQVIKAGSPLVCRARNDGTGAGQAIVNVVHALVRQQH